jgi:hypothetical protein
MKKEDPAEKMIDPGVSEASKFITLASHKLIFSKLRLAS